jgi:Holliday junction resolvase
MSGERRGRSRELRALDYFRERGYVAFRLAWGTADVVALKAGAPPLLVQVKSTSGSAFERFVPRDRALLLIDAHRAGADCALLWWPPHAQPTIIPSEAWPPAPEWVAHELGMAS